MSNRKILDEWMVNKETEQKSCYDSGGWASIF